MTSRTPDQHRRQVGDDYEDFFKGFQQLRTSACCSAESLPAYQHVGRQHEAEPMKRFGVAHQRDLASGRYGE